MQKKLDLSAPWYQYRAELAAVLERDEDVSVGPVEDTDKSDVKSVRVSVSNHTTAAALAKLLQPKQLGNVTLNFEVQDTAQEETLADILKDAFAHNRLVRGVERRIDPAGMVWTYLVMEPDVIQFPADNLADYRGNVSMLAADAARDVLTLDMGTAVCTIDLREN